MTGAGAWIHGSSLLLASTLLFAACSSTPSRAPGIDPSLRERAMKKPLSKSASAKRSGIDLRCTVNLPGDVTSTNEDLCPNFPMYATDLGGNPLARFKIGKTGRYRLAVPKGVEVLLQAEATDDWRIEFEPTGRYRAGMSVKVLFIRRP
jgi:hypothetical protein